MYQPTGENLGEGSFGSVLTYRNVINNNEYAVKVSSSVQYFVNMLHSKLTKKNEKKNALQLGKDDRHMFSMPA